LFGRVPERPVSRGGRSQIEGHFQMQVTDIPRKELVKARSTVRNNEEFPRKIIEDYVKGSNCEPDS
jgi:hypothetical protein